MDKKSSSKPFDLILYILNKKTKARVVAFCLPLLTVLLYFYGSNEPYVMLGYSVAIDAIKLFDMCLKAVCLVLFCYGVKKESSLFILPLVFSCSFSFSMEALRTALLLIFNLAKNFWPCQYISDPIEVDGRISPVVHFCYAIGAVSFLDVLLGLVTSWVLYEIFAIFCDCSATYQIEESYVQMSPV